MAEQNIFDTVAGILSGGGFHKITFSKPRDPDTLRTVGKPFSKAGEVMVQLQRFTIDGKVLHENLSGQAMAQRFPQMCYPAYSQINLVCEYGDCALGWSKKGKLLVQNRLSPAAGVKKITLPAHNRQKQYFLREDTTYPFLQMLGIQDKNGRVNDTRRAKFRQINRFLQIVDDVYHCMPRNGTLRVCDLCCGKSYLTFAVYYYLTEVKNRTVEMLGMDLKTDVILLCEKTAQSVGFAGLHFRAGDIHGYQPDLAPHMIVSLHACDIATDLVLYHANRLDAGVILSTPCCHHEMFHQMGAAGVLRPITEQSMLKQKLCDAATDALRCLWLKYEGYEVQTLELIDPEETPKNVMIRAIRKGNLSTGNKVAVKEEYDALCTALGVEPYLKKYM